MKELSLALALGAALLSVQSSSATQSVAAKPSIAAPVKASSSTKAPTATGKVALPSKPYARHPAGLPESARQYYAMTWGVDQLSAKLVESGQLVRFDYRIVDAKKAKAVNERSSSPQMYDEKARAVLQVPTMEKVGPLRQSMVPQNGKIYWMVFSNKNNLVKPGHRVSVVIGPVRLDGLIVE